MIGNGRRLGRCWSFGAPLFGASTGTPDTPDGRLIASVLRFCCLATRFLTRSARAPSAWIVAPGCKAAAVHATLSALSARLRGFEIRPQSSQGLPIG